MIDESRLVAVAAGVDHVLESTVNRNVWLSFVVLVPVALVRLLVRDPVA